MGQERRVLIEGDKESIPGAVNHVWIRWIELCLPGERCRTRGFRAGVGSNSVPRLPPLHQSARILHESASPCNAIPANGKLCPSCLSQPRGQPQRNLSPAHPT